MMIAEMACLVRVALIETGSPLPVLVWVRDALVTSPAEFAELISPAADHKATNHPRRPPASIQRSTAQRGIDVTIPVGPAEREEQMTKSK